MCTSSICIPPDLPRYCYSASREMSLFSATPRAELSYTVQISVCLASSDRSNSSLLGMLAWPSAQPPRAQILFQGMNAHTLRSVSSGLLPFSLTCPSCLFILLSRLCLPTVNLWRFCCAPFVDLLRCPSLVMSFHFAWNVSKFMPVLTRPRAVVIKVMCSWFH